MRAKRRDHSRQPVALAVTGSAVALGLLAGMLFWPLKAGGSAAGADEAQSRPTAASRPATRPAQIVPWIELTPTATAYAECVVGLRAWAQVTDLAIVSVGPAEAGVFARLRGDVPGLRVIPGLKTSPLLGHRGLNDIAAWRRVGAAARELATAAGSQILVFEHESAIKTYIEGDYRLDVERFREGIAALPDDLLYLWYPSGGMTGAMLERYVTIDRIVAELRHVRLIDHATLYGPGSAQDRAAIEIARQLDAVAKLPRIPLVYCMIDARHWPLERVPEAVKMTQSDMIIVYPGARDWPARSRRLAELLARDP